MRVHEKEFRANDTNALSYFTWLNSQASIMKLLKYYS